MKTKRKKTTSSRLYYRFEMYVRPEEKKRLVTIARKCGISVSKLLLTATRQYVKRRGYDPETHRIEKSSGEAGYLKH